MSLPEGAYDPLLHDDWDPFWKYVESFFRPVNVADMEFLRGLDVNPWGDEDLSLTVPALNSGQVGLSSAKTRQSVTESAATYSSADNESRGGAAGSGVAGKRLPKRVRTPVKAPAQDNAADRIDMDTGMDEGEDLTARLESYPLVQRLMACFLDEGAGAKVVSSTVGSSKLQRESSLFTGVGEERPLRSQQRALEDRIVTELISCGLAEDQGDLIRDLRLDQWKLRDLKTGNMLRRNSILHKIKAHGLSYQSRARQIKEQNDELEYVFLDRMIKKSKKNKRQKSRFQRLMNTRFPNYRGRGEGNVETTTDQKSIKPAKTTPSDKPWSSPPPSAPKKAKSKSKRPPLVPEVVETSDVRQGTTSQPKGSETVGGSPPASGLPPASSPPSASSPTTSTIPSGEKIQIPDDAPENVRAIVNAIERSGGEASLDFIIADYMKSSPTLSMDAARRRVVTCLSLTKKIVRFRKNPINGKYSALPGI